MKKSSTNSKKSHKERIFLDNIHVLIKDQFTTDIDLDKVLNKVKNSIPHFLFQNVEAIYIGQFKELKGNILYEEKHVYISTVNNLIKVGPLTNNQNLSLGVKNVLEEALQDKGYSLVSNAWDADMTLDVDIIYFDVEKIKTNISVFHKDENTVIIRMRGTVAKEGKVIKQQIVEDGSNEIVASTGIVAVDGKFNSTVSRNAIKKTCVLVVSKLF